MRTIAIQEKDLTLNVQQRNGRIRYAKLKKGRAIESLANRQITKENIGEITKLMIIKNEKLFEVELEPEKNHFVYSPHSSMDIPILYFKQQVFIERFEEAMKNERQ